MQQGHSVWHGSYKNDQEDILFLQTCSKLYLLCVLKFVALELKGKVIDISCS